MLPLQELCRYDATHGQLEPATMAMVFQNHTTGNLSIRLQADHHCSSSVVATQLIGVHRVIQHRISATTIWHLV